MTRFASWTRQAPALARQVRHGPRADQADGTGHAGEGARISIDPNPVRGHAVRT